MSVSRYHDMSSSPHLIIFLVSSDTMSLSLKVLKCLSKSGSVWWNCTRLCCSFVGLTIVLSKLPAVAAALSHNSASCFLWSSPFFFSFRTPLVLAQDQLFFQTIWSSFSERKINNDKCCHLGQCCLCQQTACVLALLCGSFCFRGCFPLSWQSSQVVMSPTNLTP